MRYNNKIIFFSKDLKIGGMEKALVSLLNELAKKEYDIKLVLENKCGALIEFLDSRVIVEEYHMSYCKVAVLRKAYNFLHRFCWRILNWKKYVFSCNFATYSVIGSKLAQIASDNSAFYVHSNYSGVFNNEKTEMSFFFKSLCIEKFKHILFVSYESLYEVERIFPYLSNRFIVLNNIVDKEEIIKNSNIKVEEKFNCTKTNLLFVGRLEDASKNFKLLIKSFKIAYQKDNNLRLYIIGNGPDKNMVEEEIKESGLESIFLIGEKINPYPYMRMCDSLILTSRYEGYPIVYVEALVLNKPFITTIPVRDDFIDIRNFFTITEHNPKAIADEILKINKTIINYNIDFNFANKERIRIIEDIINNRWNINENKG